LTPKVFRETSLSINY